MNKVFTPFGIIATLLLVFLLASCSKEVIIEEEVILPEEEVAERTSTQIYVESQSAMLQLFSSVVQESVESSLPISLSTSSCPDVTLTDNWHSSCDGDRTKLVLDYNDCEDGNGHQIDGKIIITSCVENLLYTTKWNLATIKLQNNTIQIDDYLFELKGANKLYFYCNIDDPNDPKFVFLAEPWAHFESENMVTHDKCTISPEIVGDWDGFMEFRLNHPIDPQELLLNFQDLYNAEYLVHFKKNRNGGKWKVIAEPNGGVSEEFRAITSEDLLFSPSYGYPFDGNVLCFYEWEPGFYSLGQDWDFGSTADGCTTSGAARDSYAEICTTINPADCVVSPGCYVWDMSE